MQTLRDAWISLPPWGRVAMLAIVALLLAMAMVLGYDLGWIPEWVVGR